MWAVAWNVERRAMCSEAECVLWDGMWNVVRCAVRQSVGCGMGCGTVVRCAMKQSVGCGTARYVVVEVVLCDINDGM